MILPMIQQERFSISSQEKPVGSRDSWTWFPWNSFFSLQLSLCYAALVFNQHFRSERRMFIHQALLRDVGKCTYRRNRSRLVWSFRCLPNIRRNVELSASCSWERPMAKSVQTYLSKQISLDVVVWLALSCSGRSRIEIRITSWHARSAVQLLSSLERERSGWLAGNLSSLRKLHNAK